MENKIEETRQEFNIFPFFSRKQPAFVLMVLGIIFYCTTLYNEYALDDGILIHQNEYVLKGVTGVPDIVTHDTYQSFYKRMCATEQLYGGRYRPLASITFALEQQIINPYRTGNYSMAYDANNNGKLDNDQVIYKNGCGKEETGYEFNNYEDLNNDGNAQINECNNCWDLNKNFKNDFDEDLNQDGVYNEVDCQVYGAMLRHFNNILLYVAACLVFYFFLRDYVFKYNPDMAFLSAVIFLIHPVHSEVVANIRGREDILSFLFIICTLFFSLRYLETKKYSSVIYASICLFLAFFSKEYSFLLLVILPLTIYFFAGKDVALKQKMILYFHFIPILFGYLYLHWLFIPSGKNVPDTELLNNPFLLATGEEQFASKVYDLLVYLRIIIFPHPLISDYSYNAIPYRDFSSWDFWASLILNLSMFGFGIYYTVKRKVQGYAILVYYIFLLATSNVIMPTGVRLLESHLFHPSMGFTMLLGWGIISLFNKAENLRLSVKRNTILILGTLVVLICLFKTWERNWDWKNDVTLFLKDVKNSPNSVLILGNAGARWIDLADTKEITGESIPGEDPKRYNDYNNTLHITDEEIKQSGMSKRDIALTKGIGYLKRAVELHPRYVNGYLNLGLASFKLNNDSMAIYYWKIAEALYPQNPYLMNYYYVYSGILKRRGASAFENKEYKKAQKDFACWTLIKPDNYESWYNLASAAYNAGNITLARQAIDKAFVLKRDDKEVLDLKESIYSEENIKKD